MINERKIYNLVENIFNLIPNYNFFESKMSSSFGADYRVSLSEISETEPMKMSTAIGISEIFNRAIQQFFYSNFWTSEFVLDEERLQTLIDDVFEMSPAFNLFEYKSYVRNASLADFKEVQGWNGSKFIVCTSDIVCKPWGFKSDDRVHTPNNTQDTIIGVAPFDCGKDAPLVMWTASDSNAFRNPDACVVGAWTDHDLKGLGFVPIS
jgi:hypothetical protein